MARATNAEGQRESRSSRRIAELYAACVPTAAHRVYAITGDPHLAEEIPQEAFVRVVGKLGALRKPEAFEAYFHRTVLNLCRGHLRRVKREHELHMRLKATTQATADLPDPDDRDEVLSALRTLSPRQQTALVLRYYEDLPYGDIAQLMDCPAGTAKSLVSRGLKSLRVAYAREDRSHD